MMNSKRSNGTIDIIIVEDNALLRAEVSAYLQRVGMAVRTAECGAELDQLLAEAPTDVVVLDLGLPAEDGTVIAQRLRDLYPAMGIVMVTARGQVAERVLGYATGADIYLVKPVDYSELEAAIRAILRGRTDQTATSSADDPAAAQQTQWRLDTHARSLTAPSGETVTLTHTETDILSCLCEAAGQTVSRAVITARLGRDATISNHRSVDQVVSRLRRKIASRTNSEVTLRSAYGHGYYLAQTILEN
ncbi:MULTISPECIES: response regulator transcription factor [Alphaproteobacteria]|uniref:response regulator transcription factor n=2 Tax=Pseudomonadota TaxID=1224 RepID=UPI0032655441